MTFKYFNKGIRHQGWVLIDSTSYFHFVDICHINIMFSLEIFLDHWWLTVSLEIYFTIGLIIGDPTTTLVVPVLVSLAKIRYIIMELSLLFYKTIFWWINFTQWNVPYLFGFSQIIQGIIILFYYIYSWGVNIIILCPAYK